MGDTVDYDEVKRNCSQEAKTLILPKGYEAVGEVDIKKYSQLLRHMRTEYPLPDNQILKTSEAIFLLSSIQH